MQTPDLSSGRAWVLRLLTLTVIALLSVSLGFGQTNYYSKSTGNLNLVATWGTATDGTGPNPPNFTANNQIFNIRNNAAPTIGADWNVSGTGSKVIVGDGTNACVFTLGGALTFTATTDIQNNGTLLVSSTAGTPYSGTLSVLAGGTYQHARDGGAIPTASWDPASVCLITGITGTMPAAASLVQNFGHFTWNCTGQTTNLYLSANIDIAGDFTVLATGNTFDHVNLALRMSNSPTGYTINVGGDFLISGNATFKMNNSTGSCLSEFQANKWNYTEYGKFLNSSQRHGRFRSCRLS